MSDYSIGCDHPESILPVVSVIVPVYNKGSYLEELLVQLRKQTFGNFECLLVDDGSTDCSGSICEQYHNIDSRFTVWHIPNSGVSHARNYGIDRCRGQYITFVDADDLIDENYLANLYECISEHHVDMVISGYRKFEGHVGNIITDHILPYKDGEYVFKDLLPQFALIQKESGIYGTCVAKIFSKDFLGNIRFDERLVLAEDFDFYLRLYARTEKVYVDSSALYYYRAMAENSTSLVLDHNIDYFSQFIFCLRYYQFLKDFKIKSDKGLDIVSWQIRNYAYLTLRYAKPQSLKRYFKSLRKHQIIPYSNCGERNLGKKLIMFSLDRNLIFIPEIYFKLYKIGRRLKGMFKNG